MTVEHPTWSIPIGENGAELIMMPCPGTKEVDLEDTILQLKESGVSAILSVMGDEEMIRLNAKNLPEVCKANDIKWFNLETGDHKVPDESALLKWASYKNNFTDILNHGGKVAVHCKGGSGRTGVGTAMILLELGWKAEQAIAKVKELRATAFGHELTVKFIKSQEKSS